MKSYLITASNIVLSVGDWKKVAMGTQRTKRYWVKFCSQLYWYKFTLTQLILVMQSLGQLLDSELAESTESQSHRCYFRFTLWQHTCSQPINLNFYQDAVTMGEKIDSHPSPQISPSPPPIKRQPFCVVQHHLVDPTGL